jgi:ubiquinone/menaquinone biosynthesis C-methylase UbiE
VTNARSWDRIAEQHHAEHPTSTDVVSYGPDMPSERELRILGMNDLAGKRVLELGCGVGASAIAFARAGAKCMAIDASSAQLSVAKRLATEADVRVEWRHGDLADLAFLGADSVDLVFSAFAVAEVADLGRVLRQVHRVLKPGAPFVVSYEHPLALATSATVGSGLPDTGERRPWVRRPYHEAGPVTILRHGEPFTLYPRTVAEVFMSFVRTGYRVDVVVEPPSLGPGADGPALVPAGIVWRARKER